MTSLNIFTALENIHLIFWQSGDLPLANLDSFSQRGCQGEIVRALDCVLKRLF